MKSPSNKLQYDLASFLSIKMASTARRSNSQNAGNEDQVEVEKRLKKRGSELSDIDIETVVNEKQEP